ncbi:MAG: hypothetical protein ACREJ5_04305 [Geminicoccaceae bacterium]
MDDDEIRRRREAEAALRRKRRGKRPAPEPTCDLFPADEAYWTVDDLPNFDRVGDFDAIGEKLNDQLMRAIVGYQGKARGGSRRKKDATRPTKGAVRTARWRDKRKTSRK